MARNYRNRELMWVKVSALFPTFKYGFQSGLDPTKRALFGQTPITSADLQGLAIGANSPKPSKAQKLFATGMEGSFCSYDKFVDLKAQQYDILPPKGRARLAHTTLRSKTMYVTINTLKYAWQMPTLVGTSADPTKVGAKAATPEDTDLIWGADFPKPPRYQYTNASTGDKFAVWGDPSTDEGAVATAGFILIKGGQHKEEHLAQLL